MDQLEFHRLENVSRTQAPAILTEIMAASPPRAFDDAFSL